jgi:protein involved in polysaccharide export with SLBB domain
MNPNCQTSLALLAAGILRCVSQTFRPGWPVRTLVIATFAALGACEAPLPVEPPVAVSPWPLGAGDRLRVIVFEQNQLGGEFTVTDDGAISLPLVGRLPVAGLTPAETENLVKERLKGKIVTDPQVNVDVLHYRPVYVYGEVARPGAYDFAGKMFVVNGISLAGGYTYRARKDRITVMRSADPDRIPVAATETTPVGPGDVIFVPERWF